MATDEQTQNPTDDQQKQAETAEQLSEQDLKQVVGGAIDTFMQFTTPTGGVIGEEKP